MASFRRKAVIMARNITEFRIEWGETDAAAIVFYPNYFRWFDRATHALFRSIGLPIAELNAQYGFAQPLLEVGCRFFSPLRYDDEVRLESSVIEVRERTFRVEHKLFKDKIVVGEGFELRAWIKIDEAGKLKAVLIPPEIVQKLVSNND